MSAKPANDISWATDANYPVTGASYDGTPVKTEPSVGRKAEGWDPAQKPAAQNFNWWQWAVYTLITWIANLFDGGGHLLELDTYFAGGHLIELYIPITVNRFPECQTMTNFTVASQLSAGDGGGNMALVAGAGGAVGYCDLRIPVGHRLNTLTVLACGSGSVGIICAVCKLPTATGIGTVIATQTSPTSAVPADMTVNVYSKTSGVSIVVGGSAIIGLTYTRTVGSWITDKWSVGQLVTISGFVNGANNFTSHTVLAVTATVLTVQSGVNSVIETSVAGVFETTDTQCDGTQSLAILFEVISGAGAGARALRYTYQKLP